MSKIHVKFYKAGTGTRISSSDCKPTKDEIDQVDLKKSASYLKDIICSKYHVAIKDIRITYQGDVLTDGQILENVGIRPGSLLYCFNRIESKECIIAKPSLMEIQQLLVTLRAATSNSAFRSTIKKLSSLDEVKEYVLKYPLISDYPITMAYLQDPEFLISLQNPELLSKVVDDMPVFAKALKMLCKRVSKETSSIPNVPQVDSYSMDDLSDEEMEAEPNISSAPINRPSTSHLQPITPTQLAAALANVSGQSRWAGGSGVPATPVGSLASPASASNMATPLPAMESAGSGTSSSSGGPITTEMITQALQNALSATSTRNFPNTTPSPNPSTADPAIPNMEESQQLMREMGIADEVLSAQALRATNGDVQAAVDLIFAQWMAD